MNTEQLQVNLPEVQAALYGVALSLDSLLVNGIPIAVFHRAAPEGFLHNLASNLMGDLEKLEEQAAHAAAGRSGVPELLAELKTRCQQMVELLTGLIAFRTLELPQLRADVARIAPLRAECVRLIQELEACLQTPRPFYQSRPSHSTADVAAFLANLERIFSEEWVASNADTSIEDA
jgi:hypothetical protein